MRNMSEAIDMSDMDLIPGMEVRLTTGQKGVLFARVDTLGRRHRRATETRWYFLPDVVGVAGVIITAQPREIGAGNIEAAYGVRGGRWPANAYRLDSRARQKVYCAHMAGEPVPIFD